MYILTLSPENQWIPRHLLRFIGVFIAVTLVYLSLERVVDFGPFWAPTTVIALVMLMNGRLYAVENEGGSLVSTFWTGLLFSLVGIMISYVASEFIEALFATEGMYRAMALICAVIGGDMLVESKTRRGETARLGPLIFLQVVLIALALESLG